MTTLEQQQAKEALEAKALIKRANDGYDVDQVDLEYAWEVLYGDNTTKIMVRIPAWLHAMLRDKAHEQRISMNKLCIEYIRKGLADG